MNNDLETIAKRYWEIYNSFDGQTHLIDLEMETINMLAEELFYNGQPYNPRQALVNMYFLGKINKEHGTHKNK